MCPDVNIQCEATSIRMRNCSAGTDAFGITRCGGEHDGIETEECPNNECGEVFDSNCDSNIFFQNMKVIN